MDSPTTKRRDLLKVSSTFRRQKSTAKWERGCFALPNRLVQDNRLTDSGFRLLAWMISCADDWIIYQTDVMNRFEWGETKMRAALDNLIEFKYLIKLGQIRTESGGWGPCEYEFSAQGFTDEEIKDFQLNSPYPGDRGSDVRGSDDQGTKQVPSILTNPNPNDVCIDDPVGRQSPPPSGAVGLNAEVPMRVTKVNMSGKEQVVSREEIITASMFSKKDWRLTEINEAWHILCEYKGAVNDGFKFIEGTIKNIRNGVRSEYANKSKSKKDATCEKNQPKIDSEDSKEKPIASKDSSLVQGSMASPFLPLKEMLAKKYHPGWKNGEDSSSGQARPGQEKPIFAPQ